MLFLPVSFGVGPPRRTVEQRANPEQSVHQRRPRIPNAQPMRGAVCETGRSVLTPGTHRIWPWPRRTRAGAHVVPVLVQLPGLLHERKGQRPPARAPPPGAVLLEPPVAAPIAPLRRSRPSPPPSPNPFPCATACPAPIRSPYRHRSSSTPPGRQAPNLRNAPRPGSQSERNLALPPVAVRCTAWFDG